MDPMFSEYGAQQSYGPICCEENFSIEYIHKLAAMEIDRWKKPEFVYLSDNLYQKLMYQLNSNRQFAALTSLPLHLGTNQLLIRTHCGDLQVKRVPHLENFCYVGCESNYEQIEWVRINAEFEKIFLGEES